MQFLWLSLFGYVLLALESPLFEQMGIPLYTPDLAIPLLLVAARKLEDFSFLFYAAILGLFLDGLTPLQPLGLNMARIIIVAYAVRPLLTALPVRGFLGYVGLGIALSIFSDLVLLVLLKLLVAGPVQYGLIFERMIPYAILTGATVPIVNWLVEWIWTRRRPTKDSIFHQ